MQLKSLAKAAESLCFKIHMTVENSGPSIHSLQRCPQQWKKCSKMVQSSAQATLFVPCRERKGTPLKLCRSDRSWSEPPGLKVSMAAWCQWSFEDWWLTNVFNCTWTLWADFSWPVQQHSEWGRGQGKNVFCRIPGNDSFSGKNIPESLSVCPSLYHTIFFFPYSQIHILRYRSSHSRRRTFGVFLMLNAAINLPFTLCYTFCLLLATVSWASLDRRGRISDGFPRGLSAGSLGCGQWLRKISEKLKFLVSAPSSK